MRRGQADSVKLLLEVKTRGLLLLIVVGLRESRSPTEGVKGWRRRLPIGTGAGFHRGSWIFVGVVRDTGDKSKPPRRVAGQLAQHLVHLIFPCSPIRSWSSLGGRLEAGNGLTGPLAASGLARTSALMAKRVVRISCLAILLHKRSAASTLSESAFGI